MQHLSPLSLRAYSAHSEPASSHVEQRNFQQESILCPNCGAHSLAAGKVKNSWYTFCKCGTYVQLCTSTSEYYD